MLELDSKLVIDEETMKSPNLCGKFTDDELARLGNWVYEGYQRDKTSRINWEKRNEAGMNLALQIQQAKSFPWPNCSNVAFPLVTMAVMQFHAIAYPSLIDGRSVVKCRVTGLDPTGKVKEKSERIQNHMNYQLLEEDAAWEEQTDRLLINLSVVGSAFKKSYFASSKGHNVSELVLARDLVMDYFASSVEACGRKTHYLPMYRNEVHERILRGTFRDVRECGWYAEAPTPTLTDQQLQAQKRAGVTSPASGDEVPPFITLEQPCSFDFDKDGYAEPYIITIEESSKAVLRIVARWDREEDVERTADKEIIKIHSTEYFTKYTFIPSPDGGIYDIGFGVFLGPLNESVNSLINQLIDSGTMATTAGGFLGRGAKLRGGVYTFAPLEWKRIDATVDDLNKAIYPLPVREPSAVLFNLLSLLINFTSRIPGATDAVMGENPGQNTPAETSRNMITQGMKVFSVIFKRTWRSMKQEFKKLYILNSIFLPTNKTYGPSGLSISREDYLDDPNSVIPVADPSITSEEVSIAKAQAVRAASKETPGYDIEVVEKNFLNALKIEGVDLFYPGLQAKPPQPHYKVQIEQIRQQAAMSKQQAADKLAILELFEEQKLNEAKILLLQAQAAKAVEEAGGVKTGHDIAMFQAAIGALKTHNDHLIKQIELMMKGEENGRKATDGRGVSGMATPPGNQGAQALAGGMGEGAPGGMG